MPPRQIGPFEIEAQIGLGGMGIVYSAIYPKNGRKVAVKVLSPGLNMDRKLLKRFEREIEILKRLNHPNIVKYYGGGTEEGQRYYAMEFIDGGSLQDKLKKRKRFSWEQTVLVGRQVASALEHAHNAGVIHRDLKPANLFLSTKGRLKLGDFGIARDTEATALTAHGKTVGTYAYMAPEQIQATHPITGKTDLYALGCLLYEVIVGETPFQADSSNPMDMLMQHLNDDPYNVTEKVPDCPVQLDQLIDRLLAKNPDDRPYDALAVHTELGEIRDAVNSGQSVAVAQGMVGTQAPQDTKDASGEPEKKKKKKKKKKKDVPFHERTWFLVLCLVVLLGATTWMLMPRRPDWYVDKWREAMRGDEYAQRDALEKYLDPYLEKFPDGNAFDEALALSNGLHANILEPALKNLGARGVAVEPPLKADCVEAVTEEDEEGLIYLTTWQRERSESRPGKLLAVNPLPALERWYQLIKTYESLDQVSERQNGWLLQVCRNHFEYFRDELVRSAAGDAYLRDYLDDVEVVAKDGNLARAQEIWIFVYKSFGKIEKFRELSEFCRLRSGGMHAVMPPATIVTGAAPVGEG